MGKTVEQRPISIIYTIIIGDKKIELTQVEYDTLRNMLRVDDSKPLYRTDPFTTHIVPCTVPSVLCIPVGSIEGEKK